MSETVGRKIRNILKIKCKSKFSAALIKTIAKKNPTSPWTFNERENFQLWINQL